jgi:hypothetical protein
MGSLDCPILDQVRVAPGNVQITQYISQAVVPAERLVEVQRVRG